MGYCLVRLSQSGHGPLVTAWCGCQSGHGPLVTAWWGYHSLVTVHWLLLGEVITVGSRSIGYCLVMLSQSGHGPLVTDWCGYHSLVTVHWLLLCGVVTVWSRSIGYCLVRLSQSGHGPLVTVWWCYHRLVTVHWLLLGEVSSLVTVHWLLLGEVITVWSRSIGYCLVRLSQSGHGPLVTAWWGYHSLVTVDGLLHNKGAIWRISCLQTTSHYGICCLLDAEALGVASTTTYKMHVIASPDLCKRPVQIYSQTRAL